EDGSTITDSASVTESTSSAPSIFSPARPDTSGGRLTDGEPVTPPLSPGAAVRAGKDVELRGQNLSDVQPGKPGPRYTSQLAAFDHDRDENGHLPLSSRNPESTLRPRHRTFARSVEDLDATPRASMYLP